MTKRDDTTLSDSRHADPQGNTLPASQDSLVTQHRKPTGQPSGRTTPSPSSGLGAGGNAPVAGELSARYEVGETLGRGGMGEVRLAQDTRIDREVAVKLMRGQAPSDEEVLRFFREARVQGALEHPAVVPVHDLGIDHSSGPYFVMKRLTGITLADVLTSKDEAVRARFPRRILLKHLVDVAFAVALAHTRGVIHRDIKPANIMLGDFGEVYVLDWGLARIAAEGDTLEGVLPLSGDGGEQTQAGALLGTPGYMSPEQARGEPVTGATDVFALGMTLYEVLTGKPALPRGIAAIPDTLIATHHRPSEGDPDVPPELDNLCARATAQASGARPSARALADSIQAYLDGDRDLEARKDLAEKLARRAADALVAGASPSTENVTASQAIRDVDDESRALAMREAARALALDPHNTAAGTILSRLMIDAPTKIPVQALGQAQAARAETRRAVFGAVKHGFLAIIVMSLTMLFLGPKIIWPVIVAATIGTAMWLVAHRLSTRPVDGRSGWFIALAICASLLLVISGLMFGPILILPVFMVGSMAGSLSQPTDFSPALPITLLGAPLVIVCGLEWTGVTAMTTTFQDGSLVITSPLVDLTPMRTIIIMGVAIFTQILNTSFLFVRTMRVQREAQDRMHAHRWHLEQLLPNDAQSTLPKPRTKRPTNRPGSSSTPPSSTGG